MGGGLKALAVISAMNASFWTVPLRRVGSKTLNKGYEREKDIFAQLAQHYEELEVILKCIIQ